MIHPRAQPGPDHVLGTPLVRDQRPTVTASTPFTVFRGRPGQPPMEAGYGVRLILASEETLE